MKTRYCPECGRSIPLDARACPYCAKTIPMHDGQIVTKTDDDKSKIVLIIVVVVFILIFSTIAIAATVYVYVSGQNWFSKFMGIYTDNSIFATGFIGLQLVKCDIFRSIRYRLE